MKAVRFFLLLTLISLMILLVYILRTAIVTNVYIHQARRPWILTEKDAEWISYRGGTDLLYSRRNATDSDPSLTVTGLRVPSRSAAEPGKNNTRSETTPSRNVSTALSLAIWTTDGKHSPSRATISAAHTATTTRAPTSMVSTLQTAAVECKLPNCVDFLSSYEHNTLKSCERQMVLHVGHQVREPTCRFMKGENSRKPVALNSQEGSGNTWLRGLLEKATGICTGFYGCDAEMRARGYLGEGIKSGHVLVVKTHVHIPKWIGERSSPQLAYEASYGSGVFLIRNPAYGAIAEYNRVRTLKQKAHESHTNAISQEEFETSRWVKFAEFYMERWRERTVNWVLGNDKHPVHVVNYENLKRDTVGEVEKILDFLQFPYSHDELTERLRENYTEFQRVHTHKSFQHYSPEQKEMLSSKLSSVLAFAKAAGKADLFLFHDYLESLPSLGVYHITQE